MRAHDGVRRLRRRQLRRGRARRPIICAVPAAHQPRQRLWRIVAKRAVLAAGAIERPIVFGGNDRPGVMLASAVRTYVNRFGVAPGGASRCSPTTTTAGARRSTCATPASRSPRSSMPRAKSPAAPREPRRRRRRMRIRWRARGRGAAAASACRRSTSRRARAARDDRLRPARRCRAAGTRRSHLACHLGGGRMERRASRAFVPGSDAAGHDRGGRRATGVRAGGVRCAEGARPAATRPPRTGFASARRPRCAPTTKPVAVTPLWRGRRRSGKAFVDFQNDVTVEDIALAEREGFGSVEHLKRYTTLGMATDQGKTSNVNGARDHGGADRPRDPGGRHDHASGRPTRRSRSARSPGTIAARHFRPTRLHAGASLGRGAGRASSSRPALWLRAQWFAAARRDGLAARPSRARCRRCARRSAFATSRRSARSTSRAPDAGAFLDRVYTNTFSTLPVGQARYGLMLREDGFVFDDGTVARLVRDRYLMSTTTANAAPGDAASRVLPPGAVAGARRAVRSGDRAMGAVCDRRAATRDVLLERLLGGAIDVSNEAFPYLACAEFMLGRHARRGCSASRSRASSATSSPCRRATATRLAARSWRPAGRSALRPTASRRMDVLRSRRAMWPVARSTARRRAQDLGFGKLVSTKRTSSARARRLGRASSTPPVLRSLGLKGSTGRLNAGAHLLPGRQRLRSRMTTVTSLPRSSRPCSVNGSGLVS